MQITPLDASRFEEAVALWDAAHMNAEPGVDQLGEPLTTDYLLGLAQSDKYVSDATVVADDQGATVGVAWGVVEQETKFGIDDYRHAAAQLTGIAVHPEHRERGVALALLSRVEAAMRKRGHLAIDCTPCAVPVDSGAYRFLNSCGYNAVLYVYHIYHDLSRFRLTSDIAALRQRLEAEGVRFRWLDPSDHDALLDMWREHFPYWSLSEGSEDIDDFRSRAGHSTWGFRYLLAEAGERLVGFIGDIWPEPGGEGSFTSPGVIPAFRGRGIGTVLAHFALDYMKSEDTSFTTYSTSGMNPAQFLYLRAGATVQAITCSWYRKLLVG